MTKVVNRCSTWSSVLKLNGKGMSTKIGILVKVSVFKCFCSVQHVKNKFANGYEIEVKMKKAELEELDAILKQFQIPDD